MELPEVPEERSTNIGPEGPLPRLPIMEISEVKPIKVLLRHKTGLLTTVEVIDRHSASQGTRLPSARETPKPSRWFRRLAELPEFLVLLPIELRRAAGANQGGTTMSEEN